MKSAGEYAASLLIRRRYTKSELIRKMKEKRYASEEIDAVVEYLSENGSLDDADYARRYVHDAMCLKGYGKLRVRRTLAEKGVCSEAIEAALFQCPQDEKESILAYLQRHKDLNRDQAIRRLVGRGFQYYDIEEVWDSLYG